MNTRRDFLKAALAWGVAASIPAATIEKAVASLSPGQINSGFSPMTFSSLLKKYMPFLTALN